MLFAFVEASSDLVLYLIKDIKLKSIVFAPDPSGFGSKNPSARHGLSSYEF